VNARAAPFALTTTYMLVYWALAAFGRDLLYNHNIDADLADDKFGAVLPYVRVAACALGMLVVVTTSGIGWTLSRVPMSLAPFCVWTLLTVAWTDSTKDTLRGSLTLLAAWSAMPILVHRLGAALSARLLLHVIVAICIVSFLVAVLMPSLGRHNAADLVQGGHDGRWRGIFSHKNGLGPWAAYGTVLPVLYGRIGMRWPVRIAGSLCALACLIFAGSATAIALAALCVGIHIGFCALRTWPAAMTMMVVATAVAAAVLVSPLGAQHFLTVLGRSEDLSGRAEIWTFAWAYVADSPWLGYGYATLGGLDLRAREASLFAQAIPGPESGYLALLLEAGLIGAALFLAAYLVCIAKGFAWLTRAAPADRLAVELYLTILISTLGEAVTESNAFVVTGYDGVIFFAALFALSTAPWPSRVAWHALRQRDHKGSQRRAMNPAVDTPIRESSPS
jgi:exopolysaccharide production protein ExoQ